MTIKNVMETDCLDIDEILLSSPKKQRKQKVIKPLSHLVKGGA